MIVGISTLDVVRANKFVQEITGRAAEVPVIGGHAGATILPLFSQDAAAKTIPADKIADLDKRVQDAGTEVVKAKNGKGSATLSMAYAGARLGNAVLSGLAGVEVTECAYVESNVTELPYFASKVTFGKGGVKTVHPLGPLSSHEEKRLKEMMPTLKEEIMDGIEYAKKNSFGGQFKVCVVGGAGGIGQPLALLMAKESSVKEVVIIDLNVAMVPAEGVAADLSHLEGGCKVTYRALTLNQDTAIEKAGDVLEGCDLVLVPAGVPRKPGQDRKDLLDINCGIAKGTVEACAKFCPNAVLGLIVNPVNSVVPAMCEMWKNAGLDPKKIVGISTLDVVRANKFVQGITGRPAEIPVIGGHAGATILPLFSQDPAGASIPADKIADLDKRVQDGGTEVVKAKNGKGSATLSMAYSGARLGKAVLSGLAGVPVTECAYVQSSVQSGLPYFASKVVFGKNGVETVLPIGSLTEHEKKRLAELTPILKGEIDDGLEYAKTREFAK